MSKGAQTVYFQFEGHPEIIQSHNWRLEMDVNMHRNRLGLPYYTRYKTISHDDIDPNPGEDLTTLTSSSNVGNTDLTTPVPKSARKRKTKSKTPDVSTVQHILDEFAPTDNLPQPDTDGSTNSISHSVDE